jgi:hypothetical protein
MVGKITHEKIFFFPVDRVGHVSSAELKLNMMRRNVPFPIQFFLCQALRFESRRTVNSWILDKLFY